MGKKMTETLPKQSLTETAETVLARRYYLKDQQGNLLENWQDLCHRVADAVAAVDSEREDYETLRSSFFNMIYNLDFLPNSPCLMNAGTDLGQLSACFVLPVEDSMDGIFTSIRNGALVHKTGGGTGYSFSRLRPMNSAVRSTQGVASGPLSFAAVFDAATETIKQGGKRRGANMGVLRVDHPDIMDFITAKQDQSKYTNFNFSVAITDTFMDAVKNDQEYDLVDPSNSKVVDTLPATRVFDKIIDLAWHNGEPGVLFIDAANRDNSTPQLGEFEATNPCITADSWVQTGNGPYQVANLVNRKVELVVDGKPWSSTDRGFFSTGRKEIFELQTREGYCLRLTADHPVRKVTRKTRWSMESSWVKAGEITENDEIMLHDHRSLQGWSGQGTTEQGYLLGLLLSDGTLKPEAAVLSICQQQVVNGTGQPGSSAVMAEAERCAATLFHRSDFTGFHPVTGRDEWRLQSAPLRDLALKMGMAPGLGNKKITPRLERQSSCFYQGFLRGLFDADGSVQGNHKKGISVRLTQSSRSTLAAVQRMLLRFGIVSTILSRRSAAGVKEMPNSRGGAILYQFREQFELLISRDNLQVFVERIGFADAEKQAKLETLLTGFKHSLNRERFTGRVKDVERVGSEEVFDVQVPGINAFDANGLYVHNCGEQWLLPYESCNLGSINLGQYVKDGAVDFDRLGETVGQAVRFLDNVIDCNRFPIPEIAEMTQKTRKIGLGVMGMHDMLIQLELSYGDKAGRDASARVMRFIREQAEEMSVQLAELKGAFPAYDSEFNHYPARRNAALTSIQPTGTVSMIADCASGCEPYFSIVMEKNVMDGDRFLMVNKHFEAVARAEGFLSDDLMEKVAQSGTVTGHDEIPEKWQRIFCTAQDISPEAHIRMQGALQLNGVDSSISKTINLPTSATKEDVRYSYMLGHELGCKGLTVYRDGSRDAQVLNTVAGYSDNTAMVSSEGAVHKNDLPDVLSAKRYRLKDANSNTIYLIVCFDDNENPMEVFAKFPFDNRVDLKDKSTMWTTTCRLVSLALRYQIPMEEVIKQLDRSSGHMLDLPAQLGKLLKSFMAGTQKGFHSKCPECSGILVFEEGCEICRDCGYSKCS
jgi:ribonucleoside-diphosphate reductase alpha chain